MSSTMSQKRFFKAGLQCVSKRRAFAEKLSFTIGIENSNVDQGMRLLPRVKFATLAYCKIERRLAPGTTSLLSLGAVRTKSHPRELVERRQLG
jgi:hypothetical protein